MAVFDLFSKREKRRERAGQEDVFQYDNLPESFRVQVFHIWRDALGTGRVPGASSPQSSAWWTGIHDAVAREHCLFKLSTRGNDAFSCCLDYFMQTAGTVEALDLIELSFRFVDIFVREMHPHERRQMGLADPDKAIAELNTRFRDHGIGYQFEGGVIVRVDSEYLHAEAVKPALQLLNGAGKGFAGPLEEFLKAHDHYRKGDHKDAVLNAGKAFESTLKAVCAARRWQFDPKHGASDLVKTVFAHGLVPTWLQGQFNSLRSLLDTGLNVVRNKAAHGQGPTPTDVPDHLVAYALHLAAANIVFLVQAHKATP